MRANELFNKNLTRVRHERDDIHYIGEALPAPSQVATTLSTGTPASVGGSSVPAREDYIHALDMSDLEDAIDAIVTGGSTTLVNTTYVQNFTYNTYLGDADDTSDGPTGAFYNEIVFSFEGLITGTSVSPYWPVPWGHYAYEVGTQMNTSAALGVSLVVAGSGSMWSTTLTDSTTVANHSFGPTARTRNEKIRAEITDEDDGLGANLTIVLRYLWWDNS